MKNTAVIYTRVSSDEQVQNMSLGEQERLCRDFCARKDISVDEVFVEEGESAKTADRTKLKELLEYCRKNKKVIGHLVVYKMDRFARNMEDHTALKVLLKKMNIILWSATEPVDGSTTGKLMENVLASFAQFDNDQRSERCSAGMKARALEGCYVTYAPVGYVNTRDEAKRPTLKFADKETVEKVRKFFNEFETGKYRHTHAVDVANKLKLRTHKGKPFSKNGAMNMLTNITYAGYIQNSMTDNRKIKAIHPPIIDIEQFMSVQAVIQGKKRPLAPEPRHKGLWILRRFLKCWSCKRPLTGSASKGRSGQYFAAYHCTRCTKKTVGASVRLPKEQAHEDFGKLLEKLVPSSWAIKAFKEIVVRRWDQEFRHTQEERRKLDEELTELENRRNELMDRWLDGRIKDDKLYQGQIDRLTIKQEELELERSEMKSDEIDKRKVVNEAVYFVTHAREIWTTVTPEDKVRFQKLVFETGILLNPDKTFGTAGLSPIYEQLTDIEEAIQINKVELPNENSTLVDFYNLARTHFSTKV